jgi:putative membrane protein
LDRRLGQTEAAIPHITWWVLLGCGLYYGVLIFNLSITFCIGEGLLGTTGVFIYLPITVLLAL